MNRTNHILPDYDELRRMYRLSHQGYDLLSNNGWKSFSDAFLHYINQRSQYKKWIRKNEPFGPELKIISEECKKFHYTPKISIVMPTWNTCEPYLRAAIESILAQAYGNWELCISDGNSTKQHVKRVLYEYSSKDPRIMVKFLTENEGIAGNSNEAISLATGEFVGFLDHDDELLPFALYDVVKALNDNNNLCLIYSDEDKIDTNGKRVEPFFKPDWSPDLFNSCNYLCHFTVIRKRILDEIGGFARGYDGSQDYDLFLRATETIKGDEIYHIPRILYHWRMIPESTAAACSAKPYARIAAKKALSDSMMRRGIEISEISDGLWPGCYRTKYALIGDPKVSILIPNRDNTEILKNCIDSILSKTNYINFEIVVIDNQSRSEAAKNYYVDLIKTDRVKLLYYDYPFNYSAMNNFAASKTSSDYILFLNNDTEIISGEWLSAMLEHVQRNEVGAVGGKLLFKNGTIQHCGIVLGLGEHKVAGHIYHNYSDFNGYMGIINLIRNCSAVTAACMLTKRSAFKMVGGFDEVNLPIAFNDVDYCLKLRQHGYYIVYTPYAQMYHHESLSRGSDNSPDAQKRFSDEANYMITKWGKFLDKDSFYSPNLSKTRGDCSIIL